MRQASLLLILLLLSCCTGETKPVETPDATGEIKKGQSYQDSLAASWYGVYETYVPGGNIGGVNTGWSFLIDVNPRNCVFTGDGYQMGFKYKCAPVFTADTLYINYRSEIIGGEEQAPTSSSSTYIIRSDEKFYFQSEKIPSEVSKEPELNGYPMIKRK
jgi:hypothetical protein